MKPKSLILVGGPTASGKSSTALVLADRFKGTIVNADSMQVYEDLQILTARPDDQALAQVPHELYGVFTMDERCSAGEWCRRALSSITAAHDAGRVPIVVGGTGLYLHALTNGLHSVPSVPRHIREDLNARLRAHGVSTLYTELLAVDPETASRLKPTDGQRIVRALEVFIHTGKSLSQWQTGERGSKPVGLRIFTLLTMPKRDILYANINARFERMVQRGAIEEVENFLAQNPSEDSPLMKVVGVSPISAFLNNEIDRCSLFELGKRDTRQYAKRQSTWFRNKFVPNFTIETQYSEKNKREIFSKISTFLLTD